LRVSVREASGRTAHVAIPAGASGRYALSCALDALDDRSASDHWSLARDGLPLSATRSLHASRIGSGDTLDLVRRESANRPDAALDDI
jgi:hypothetical protein